LLTGRQEGKSVGAHVNCTCCTVLSHYTATLQVFTVKFQVAVFWVVTLCSAAVGYERLGGPLLLPSSLRGFITQKTSTWNHMMFHFV